MFQIFHSTLLDLCEICDNKNAPISTYTTTSAHTIMNWTCYCFQSCFESSALQEKPSYVAFGSTNKW